MHAGSKWEMHINLVADVWVSMYWGLRGTKSSGQMAASLQTGSGRL